MSAQPNQFSTAVVAASTPALGLERDAEDIALRRDKQAREAHALSVPDMLVRRQHEDPLASHPVCKTPIDILILIFAHCVDDLRHLSAVRVLSPWDKALRHRQLQPFWIAHVCRRWRTAALAQPRIWCLFELRTGISKRRSAHNWIRYLNLLHSRCGAIPVHIGLYRSGQPGLHDSVLTSHLASLLDRCRTICVFQSRILQGDPTLLVLRRHTPRLERLDIQVTHVHSSVALLLPHAPLLRVLTGSYPFGDTLFDFSSLSTADLQSVSCSAIHDDLSALLGLAPSLRELRVTAITTGGLSPGPPAVSGVTRLRLISDDIDSSLLALIGRIEFPSLETCDLDGLPAASQHRVQYVIGLAGASQSLAHVVVGHLDQVGIRLLADNLHALQAVRALVIRATFFTRTSFTHLCTSLHALDDDGYLVCPALIILSLSCCTFQNGCDEEALVRCVRSRLLAAQDVDCDGAPARLVHVTLPRTITPATAAAVTHALENPEEVRRSLTGAYPAVLMPRILEVMP